LGVIQNRINWEQKERHYPIYEFGDNIDEAGLCFIEAKTEEIIHEEINFPPNAVLILTTTHLHGMADHRRVFNKFLSESIKNPIIVRRSYDGLSDDTFQLHASTDFGSLLIDGLSDGVWLDSDLPSKRVMATIFGFFQATRTRISKTEYISCPSCGRTLFDLQETTQMIRSRTSHLKGVKIGIMGCIVNGPGEMADADYGYVGSGHGRITLYKGQEVVEKSIPSAEAVDKLIELIQEYGDWVEK
jgi:(E)-4-hydroxy-3-methylbut-2-enyl-diphosphate synthase